MQLNPRYLTHCSSIMHGICHSWVLQWSEYKIRIVLIREIRSSFASAAAAHIGNLCTLGKYRVLPAITVLIIRRLPSRLVVNAFHLLRSITFFFEHRGSQCNARNLIPDQFSQHPVRLAILMVSCKNRTPLTLDKPDWLPEHRMSSIAPTLH
jgi:hypothetical protein